MPTFQQTRYAYSVSLTSQFGCFSAVKQQWTRLRKPGSKSAECRSTLFSTQKVTIHGSHYHRIFIPVAWKCLCLYIIFHIYSSWRLLPASSVVSVQCVCSVCTFWVSIITEDSESRCCYFYHRKVKLHKTIFWYLQNTKLLYIDN